MIDGQYIRLRNVRLGYNFDTLFSSFGVNQVELALSGVNLFTWKRSKWGGDPEGFNFGEDFGSYPHLRRYALEVRVVF